MNRIIPSAVVLATGLLLSGAAADAQQTEGKTVYAKVQQLGRWCGWGWGDGYHACNDSSWRPLADLPPKSFSDAPRSSPAHLQYRWNDLGNSVFLQPAMQGPMPASMTQWTEPSEFVEPADLFHPPLEAFNNELQLASPNREEPQGRQPTERQTDQERLPAPKPELDELDARSRNSVPRSLVAARLPLVPQTTARRDWNQRPLPTSKPPAELRLGVADSIPVAPQASSAVPRQAQRFPLEQFRLAR